MELKQVVKIVSGLNEWAIERAVMSFCKDSHISHLCDIQGLYQQSLEVIAKAIAHPEYTQFWVYSQDGEVKVFVLTSQCKDVDNRLTYWINQAWVEKSMQRKPEIKQWYQMLREEAKKLGCKHIIVPSSRGTKAYLRFLGKGWHEYIHLLKEDI